MDNDLIFGTEASDMLAGGTYSDDVQVAAVPGAEPSYADALTRPFDAAQVVIPEGADIVRIPVAPGEVVELPFPPDAQFLAEIGNGNLAIKVGDVTVILQGYVEAAGQTAPVIEASNGQPLDIATILASTDPNIDIQTAAGPAAGPQGQGADNSGGILQQFGGGAGLGGFAGAGALDGTEGPGNGPVDVDGPTILPFGVLAADAGTPNVPPIFKAGLVAITNRSEDAADTHQFLNWTVIDPDSAGHTLSVDPATLPPGVTFNPVNNKLELDTKGHYDYLKAGEKETFTITFFINDGDGNSVQQDFTLEMVGKNDAPVTAADTLLTDGGKGVWYFPQWVLTANDKDVDGDLLLVNNVAGFAGNGKQDLQAFFGLADVDKTYTVTDGTVTSAAKVVHFNHDTDGVAGTVTGTAGNDIVLGQLAVADKLHGNDGNDIIAGFGGGDEVFGGKGDDTLVFNSTYGTTDTIHGEEDSVAITDGLEGGAAMHGDILAVADLKLDFSDSAKVAKYDGIETISTEARLGGFDAQSVTIGAQSVQGLSDHTITPGGVFPEKEAVRIDGDAVDQLYLSISKDGGNWVDTGVVANGYHVFAHETTGGDPTTTDAYVMVQTANVGNVHLNQDAP